VRSSTAGIASQRPLDKVDRFLVPALLGAEHAKQVESIEIGAVRDESRLIEALCFGEIPASMSGSRGLNRPRDPQLCRTWRAVTPVRRVSAPALHGGVLPGASIPAGSSASFNRRTSAANSGADLNSVAIPWVPVR